MKFLVAFACLLAVASAGYLNSPVVGPAVAYGAYGAYGAYDDGSYKGEGLIESQDLARVAVAAPIAYAANTYAAHTYAAAPVVAAAPVIARASHAVAYNAPLVSAPHPVAVAAPIAYAAHTYAAAPVVARASHAVAYNAPLVSAPHPVPIAHAYAAPIAHAYAAPIAHAYAGPIAHAYAAPAVGLASEARLVDPIAIAAGAPLPTGDTLEVAAAKAAHAAAHHDAKATHFLAKGHLIAKRSPVYLGAYSSPLAYSGFAAPIARTYGYAAPYSYGYGRLGAFYG